MYKGYIYRYKAYLYIQQGYKYIDKGYICYLYIKLLKL